MAHETRHHFDVIAGVKISVMVLLKVGQTIHESPVTFTACRL